MNAGKFKLTFSVFAKGAQTINENAQSTTVLLTLSKEIELNEAKEAFDTNIKVPTFADKTSYEQTHQIDSNQVWKIHPGYSLIKYFYDEESNTYVFDLTEYNESIGDTLTTDYTVNAKTNLSVTVYDANNEIVGYIG